VPYELPAAHNHGACTHRPGVDSAVNFETTGLGKVVTCRQIGELGACGAAAACVWMPLMDGWQGTLDTTAPMASKWRQYRQRELHIPTATAFNQKVHTFTGADKTVASCQEACLLDRLGCGAFTWDLATGECVITPLPYYNKGIAEDGMANTVPTPIGSAPSVIVHHTREYWQLVRFEQRRLALNDFGAGEKVRRSDLAANYKELRCTHTTDDEGDTGQAARCRAHTRMIDCVHNTYEAPGEVERPCVFIPKQLPDTSWWEVITGNRLTEPTGWAGYSETVTLPAQTASGGGAATADDYIETCARLCSSYDTPCEAFSYKDSDRTCALTAAQQDTTGASLTADSLGNTGWVYYESMDDMTTTLGRAGAPATTHPELDFTWGFALEASGSGLCTHTSQYRKDAAKVAGCLSHNTAFGTHANEHVNAAACAADAACKYLPDYMSTVDGSTWRVRNERSLNYASSEGALIDTTATHRILATGGATAEHCGRACIAWPSGCKSFGWDPTAKACHVTTQLEHTFAVEANPIRTGVNQYRKEMRVSPTTTYYELIYLHQTPSSTELVCRHLPAWSAYPGVVATCKSHLYWE